MQISESRTELNQQDITVQSPRGIGMEKQIRLHVDELWLNAEKEIRGRKMASFVKGKGLQYTGKRTVGAT